MKLELIEPNYCWTIVKIDKLLPLDNCDNLLWFPIFWFMAIVSKDTQIGDVGIVFTAETQLSDDYCRYNNLYREPTLNIGQTKKGYIEANRRIRAVKLRGNKSSALFMPFESLYFVCGNPPDFLIPIGDSFNVINDQEICRKYFVPTKNNSFWNKVKWKNKKFIRIDNLTFPEHQDSEQYLRNLDRYKDNDYITVTQKLHGTSTRLWYVKVRKPLRWYEKLLQKIGIYISDTEYDTIWASRRVIKNGDIKEWTNTWFYQTDVWRTMADKYKNSFPKDYIFYGEIIGWTEDGKAIQKDYTYNQPRGEADLYIYRIAIVNDDGISVDLSYNQIVELCNQIGLKVVPLLWEGYHKDFVPSNWIDKQFLNSWFKEALPLSDNTLPDEGVCIRIDRLQPYVTKLKSPTFFEHETKLLDAWVEDLETQESI